MSIAFQCERCHGFFPGRAPVQADISLYARGFGGPAIGYWHIDLRAHSSGGAGPEMCAPCLKESLKAAMLEHIGEKAEERL